MIKKYTLPALMIFALFLGIHVEPTKASDSNEQILKSFSRQVEILTLISPTVERIDQSRLFVVRNSAAIVLQDMQNNIAANKPIATFQTLRLIQNLIIQYRFSQNFFGWIEPISMTSIYSDSIARYLTELKNISKKVESDFGLDDSPYTQITSNTFKQMQKLLKQLELLSIDVNLKTELRALWPEIGATIAIADQGDRPRAFEKAALVIEKIRDLYPHFDQISSSAAGFSSILELQGLAEFYAEFAQME